jgi:hypothetical protein
MSMKAALPLAVLSAAVISSAALGYILPGGFLLAKVAEHRNAGALTALVIDGTAAVMTAGGEVSGVARIEWKTPGSLEIRVSSSGTESIRIDGGRLVTNTPGMKPLAGVVSGVAGALLLMFPSPATSTELGSKLASMNVNMGKSCLARFHGRVATVLGAGAGDRASPQVWIDKDSFQILRMILPAAPGGAATDIKFTDYQSSPLQGRFPRSIEIWSKGVPLFRFEADQVRGAGQPEE